MNAGDLANNILRAGENARANEARVVVFSPGSIGPSPSVGIKSAVCGFDWDNGTLLIHTDEPLTQLSPEDVKAIRESISKGTSWHAYQAHKKQADCIKALEAELAEIKGAKTLKGGT